MQPLKARPAFCAGEDADVEAPADAKANVDSQKGRDIDEGKGADAGKHKTPDRIERCSHQSALPLPPSRYGSYAPPSRVNLISLAASGAITVGMILAIMHVGFVTHSPMRSEPMVVHLIALPTPPPTPPRPPSPKPPTSVRLPTEMDPVASPAPSAPASVVDERVTPSVPVPPIRATHAERSAPGVAAPPSIPTADLSTRLLSAPPPRYPLEARRRREQGTVVLNVLLSIDGRVLEISVDRSSGSNRLDKAALAAVSRWRWSPTLQGAVPTMVRGLVTIPFELQG